MTWINWTFTPTCILTHAHTWKSSLSRNQWPWVDPERHGTPRPAGERPTLSRLFPRSYSCSKLHWYHTSSANDAELLPTSKHSIAWFIVWVIFARLPSPWCTHKAATLKTGAKNLGWVSASTTISLSNVTGGIFHLTGQPLFKGSNTW